MNVQRGGWNAIEPMLGDESEDDCGSWMWSDAAIAVMFVAVLGAIFAGWI